MLINCPECNKSISDEAPSCPHCGYVSRKENTEAQPQLLSNSIKTSSTFQIIALCSIFVALFTPRIIISIPCLIIIITSIISIFRKEPRVWVSVITICIGLFFMVASSSDFKSSTNAPSAQENDEASYIPKLKINEDWKYENEGSYTYIRGRVTNEGDKVIRYFKISAYYYDKNGKVLDTAYTNSGENLYPNMSKEFEISHKQSKEYKSANIVVDEVSLK